MTNESSQRKRGRGSGQVRSDRGLCERQLRGRAGDAQAVRPMDPLYVERINPMGLRSSRLENCDCGLFDAKRSLDCTIDRFNCRRVACSISRLKRSRGTVSILSKLATHRTGRPCWRPRITSVGKSRIVLVTSATTTPPIVGSTASRVRMSTGRLPTGRGRSAHHTSARLTSVVLSSRPARGAPKQGQPGPPQCRLGRGR